MTPSKQYGLVLAVVDDQFDFQVISDTLTKHLQFPQFGLPQDEHYMDVTIIKKHVFKDHFKSFRHIIFFEATKGKAKSSMSKNKWAHNQYITTISAPGTNAALQEFKQIKPQVLSIYHNKDIEFILQRQKMSDNRILNEKIRDLFNLSFNFPGETQLAKKDSTSFWIRLEKERNKGGFQHQISEGVVGKIEPYKDTLQLEPKFIIENINMFLKQNVEGDIKGSYMQIADQFISPQSEVKEVNGYYTIETRGLWRMVDGLRMGGPFVNYTIVKKDQSEIIYLFGYVYAPSFQKREYLAEVEAMLKSFYMNQ